MGYNGAAGGIDSYISKVADLGFLRPAKNAEPVYEVRRILKAFVDAQWLADFDARLAGSTRRMCRTMASKIGAYAGAQVSGADSTTAYA